MALGTVTVRSALKFHAERSGREIQGSHGDPLRAIFCFQLRPPISGEHFFEPAPQFKSLPPFVPPTSNPTPKSTPFVSPKKRPNGCRHPSFFRIHVDNINFLTPQHQFSSSKPEGGLAFKLGGVLGNWTNEKPPNHDPLFHAWHDFSITKNDLA